MTNNTKNDVLEGFLFSTEPSLDDSIQKIPSQDYKTLFNKKNDLPEGVKNASFAKIRDHYKDSSVDGLLKDLQGGKMMSMKELMDDIETLINERKTLKKEVFEDAEKILISMNNFLASKADRLEAVEEVTIKEKLLDIESFKLQEKINAFRDIAALKKELRDRTQEFKEKENNISIIDELLDWKLTNKNKNKK